MAPAKTAPAVEPIPTDETDTPLEFDAPELPDLEAPATEAPLAADPIEAEGTADIGYSWTPGDNRRIALDEAVQLFSRTNATATVVVDAAQKFLTFLDAE